jgi:dinuclear metal center YbgI/SA1388 family protein
MIKLNELCADLDLLLPSKGIVDYCPNGLQVEGKQSILRLATAVSASLETIEAAIRQGIDALIVHHGIFWKGDSYVIRGVKKEKLNLLMQHGISLIAYHLPLDLHQSLGNNWKAAMDLGWGELQPFGFMNGVAIGVKGIIPSESREQVKSKLERYYGHSAACAFGGKERIESLALISGGSYRSLIDAASEGVDAFITGNFDEPVWHQAFEEKVNFFALGHSATERVGPIALGKYLEKQYSIPCDFLDINNPF